MIAEAIQHLIEVGNQAASIKPIKLPGEATNIIHIPKLTSGGGVELVKTVLEPPHRRIAIGSLEDIAELASSKSGLGLSKPAIFYSETVVTLVFDTKSGYEIAQLPMATTAEYSWFKSRLSQPGVSVRQLVDDLQTTLCMTRGSGADSLRVLTEQVGRLSIGGTSNQSAQAGKGMESVSKSIMQQVASPESLPDELQTFGVRMFATRGAGWRHYVTCTLHPRVSDGTWSIKPIEQSWLEYHEENMKTLGELLAKSNVPVFHGTWGVVGN